MKELTFEGKKYHLIWEDLGSFLRLNVMDGPILLGYKEMSFMSEKTSDLEKYVLKSILRQNGLFK